MQKKIRGKEKKGHTGAHINSQRERERERERERKTKRKGEREYKCRDDRERG